MRFDKLIYDLTVIFDDVQEIKFVANFTNEEFKNDVHLVELWVQDDSVNPVIMCYETNDMHFTNDKEEEKLIHLFQRYYNSKIKNGAEFDKLGLQIAEVFNNESEELK